MAARRARGAPAPPRQPVSARPQQQTVAAGAGRRRAEEGGEACDGEGEEALLERGRTPRARAGAAGPGVHRSDLAL